MGMFGWLLLTVFILGTRCEHNSKVLQLIQIVYRHGDRTPISLYPNDPNLNYKWPEGLGELTNLGKLQHYVLGRFLKDRYKDFLTDNPEEVYVRSSGKNRCLESAECHLASMYPPNGKWIWNRKLDWQPIPVQTVPLPEDKLLNPSAFCPEAEKEEIRIRNSPAAKEYLKKYQKLFEYLTNNSGMKVMDWRQVRHLYSTMSIEKKYNLTVPSWADLVWDEMRDVSAKAFYWYTSTKLMQRLRAGPLLDEIIKNMMQKAKGELTNGTKLFMYSTHDTMIAAVLNALGIFNGQSPPYCSTIIFELYSEGFRDHTVKILFLNSSEPQKEPQTPYVFKLSSCSAECQLGKFVQLTRDVIPNNWKKECGLEHDPEILSQQAVIIIVVLGLLLTILLIIVTLVLWRYCCREDDSFPYQLVPSV